jgi:hypothetical protein
MKKWLLFMLPLVTLVLSALAWKLYQPSNQPSISLLPMSSQCQLHINDCVIEHEGVSVRLSISPRPIPIAKSLNIIAEIAGVDPEKVQLDINGSNMYMGYNRVNLTQSNSNVWQGKSILSFCTIDEMQWQITLLIHLADGHQIQAPFALTTPFQPKHP